jgi:hypothetical protein
MHKNVFRVIGCYQENGMTTWSIGIGAENTKVIK